MNCIGPTARSQSRSPSWRPPSVSGIVATGPRPSRTGPRIGSRVVPAASTYPPRAWPDSIRPIPASSAQSRLHPGCSAFTRCAAARYAASTDSGMPSEPEVGSSRSRNSAGSGGSGRLPSTDARDRPGGYPPTSGMATVNSRAGGSSHRAAAPLTTATGTIASDPLSTATIVRCRSPNRRTAPELPPARTFDPSRRNRLGAHPAATHPAFHTLRTGSNKFCSGRTNPGEHTPPTAIRPPERDATSRHRPG